MPSQTEAVFDIPQSRPPVLSRFYQDVRGYDNQQVMISPPNAGLATGTRLGDYVLSYLYDYPQPNQDFTEQLRILHQNYTILDDNCTVIELLATEPVLYSLLIEAIKPLRHAFGDKRMMHVRVQSSDEDSILKVAVQLPHDFGADPERALWSFDEEWWLNNCHRSGGALVFDYEMPDVIRLA